MNNNYKRIIYHTKQQRCVDDLYTGLLRDCEDFYENKHINSDLLAVNFTDMYVINW